MKTWKALEAMIDELERSDALDPAAGKAHDVARRAIPQGAVEDALSGTALGHPVHPLLVAVPIGAWVSATLFDAIGDDAAARRLIAIGCASAVPTAAAGLSDWLSTDGAERRVGFAHALFNDAALTAYTVSWFARRRGNRRTGVALALVGAGLLSAGGYLGGHLAYAQGVGVDTTAFVKVPTDWVDIGAEDQVPGDGSVVQLHAGAVAVLVSRRAGTIVAMLDRCTHRGAPLSDGTVEGDCIVCPWHDSRFSLVDGSVTRGPASRPQPLLESRVQDGRLQVRRDESRSLRTNPVGG